MRRVAQGVGPPASGALSPSLSMASLDTAPSCPVGHPPTPSSMRGREGTKGSQKIIRKSAGAERARQGRGEEGQRALPGPRERVQVSAMRLAPSSPAAKAKRKEVEAKWSWHRRLPWWPVPRTSPRGSLAHPY